MASPAAENVFGGGGGSRGRSAADRSDRFTNGTPHGLSRASASSGYHRQGRPIGAAVGGGGGSAAMTYRRGAKDDGCCSVGFLKCLLHTFNFIFLLSGCAVLGVGVWTLVAKRHHLSLLTTATYASTAYMLVLAGALVILVTALGCVAVCRLHRCFLLAYTFLLLLIFLMEAVAGIIAYVYEEQVKNESFFSGQSIRSELSANNRSTVLLV